eukprot:TRINITY_DN7714_c0_g1_i1.p1 TRINITY_DN7714_c0_g1~~TRINITY_DN7714_c0_g1_i1.p1  ORF type:complete len:286 (+),score=38.36 TRINITY_DN7714_c0_g1_i1:22-858(+)
MEMEILGDKRSEPLVPLGFGAAAATAAGTPHSRIVSRRDEKFTAVLDYSKAFSLRGVGNFAYHFVTNQAWWKLILVSFCYYFSFCTVFSFVYWLDYEHLTGSTTNKPFLDSWFFSLQTQSSIGFGSYIPVSEYLVMVCALHYWMTITSDAVIVAVILTKISRPTTLRHSIKFSSVAVINGTTATFRVDESLPLGGVYESDGEVPSLNFRVMNSRERQLVDIQLHLYMMMRENGKYIVHEMDYECTRSFGRMRDSGSHLPFLVLLIFYGRISWVVSRRC